MRKAKITLIVLMLALASAVLCACSKSFECDLCGLNSKGNSYNLSGWGYGYVCEECYDMLCGRG